MIIKNSKFQNVDIKVTQVNQKSNQSPQFLFVRVICIEFLSESRHKTTSEKRLDYSKKR